MDKTVLLGLHVTHRSPSLYRLTLLCNVTLHCFIVFVYIAISQNVYNIEKQLYIHSIVALVCFIMQGWSD